MKPFSTVVSCWLTLAALVIVGACATTAPSGGTASYTVQLRRIDVVEADYDSMLLDVVLGVENGSGGEVDLEGNGFVIIAGEAKPADAEAGEAASEATVDAAVEATAATAAPEGERFEANGRGKAPAFNTSELPLRVEVNLPSDPAVLEPMLGFDKLALYIEGQVKVGGQVVAFSGVRDVAPPRLPAVVLKEAQVASVDGGTAGSGFFTLILDNKNPFPVTVDKVNFDIAIKDKVLSPSSGNTSAENDEIPASAVAEYQVEVLINEAAFGKDLKPLLKQPTVPYVVTGTMQVRGISKSFRFAGDMKFAR